MNLYPTKTPWQNSPSIASPVNSLNLNKIENGLFNIAKAVDHIETDLPVMISDSIETAEDIIISDLTAKANAVGNVLQDVLNGINTFIDPDTGKYYKLIVKNAVLVIEEIAPDPTPPIGGTILTDIANLKAMFVDGSWTPSFKGGTTPGATTYIYNTGRYSKVGKTVTLQCSIAVNVKDVSMSGDLYIDGLPFPCNSSCAAGISIGRAIKFDMPTGFSILHGRIGAGSNRIYFFPGGDNQTSSNGLDVSSLQNGTILDFTVVYLTD